MLLPQRQEFRRIHGLIVAADAEVDMGTQCGFRDGAVSGVADDIAHRCGKCYEMRLFEAAKQAKEGGFDSFTSSLFISPYQNHELMAQIAQQAADTYGVEFLYRDFRPYFKDGQAFAREKGFYMQKYCGCVFSEEERYLKAKKIIP